MRQYIDYLGASLKVILAISAIILIGYFVSLKDDSQIIGNQEKSHSSQKTVSTEKIKKNVIAPIHKENESITHSQSKDFIENKLIPPKKSKNLAIEKYKKKSHSSFKHEDFLKKVTADDFKQGLSKSQEITHYQFPAKFYFSGNYQGSFRTAEGIETIFKLQLGVGKHLGFSDRDCFALYEDGSRAIYGSVKDDNFSVFQLDEPHHIAFQVENYIVEGYAEFPHSRDQIKMIFRVYLEKESGLKLLGIPKLIAFPRIPWDDTCATEEIFRYRR